MSLFSKVQISDHRCWHSPTAVPGEREAQLLLHSFNCASQLIVQHEHEQEGRSSVPVKNSFLEQPHPVGTSLPNQTPQDMLFYILSLV